MQPEHRRPLFCGHALCEWRQIRDAAISFSDRMMRALSCGEAFGLQEWLIGEAVG